MKEGREKEEVMRVKHNGGFGRWGTYPDIMTLPLLTTVPYLSSASLLCPLFAVPTLGTLVWFPYSLTQTSSLPVSFLKSISTQALEGSLKFTSVASFPCFPLHTPSRDITCTQLLSEHMRSSSSGTKVSKKGETGSVRIKRGREKQVAILDVIFISSQFSSVQLLSCVRLFATPWIAARQASLSITNSQSSPNSHPSSRWCHPAISSCHPLLLLPPIPPSIRVFSNEATLRMRPKYWSFSLGISPSNEYPGLISFRMDWLDLLAVQGTLKSLLQHHTSKASILRHSAYFTVQLSHPYMTTGKTVALTRRILVGKVMSLLLNMLSRLVITFLPRSRHLLILWLQSPSAVILEPKEEEIYYCFHICSFYLPCSNGAGCHDLHFFNIHF